MIFAYDDWNREHVRKHGVQYADAEYVIEHARSPYPQRIDEGKYIVYGPDRYGRILEVVFAYRSGEELDFRSLALLELGELSDSRKDLVAVYIIHAMPVTGRRARRYRRRRP